MIHFNTEPILVNFNLGSSPIIFSHFHFFDMWALLCLENVIGYNIIVRTLGCTGQLIGTTRTYHFINQTRGGGKRVTPDSGHGQAIGQRAFTIDSNWTTMFQGFRETRHAVGFNSLKTIKYGILLYSDKNQITQIAYTNIIYYYHSILKTTIMA